jgi:hypothetical protein
MCSPPRLRLNSTSVLEALVDNSLAAYLAFQPEIRSQRLNSVEGRSSSARHTFRRLLRVTLRVPRSRADARALSIPAASAICSWLSPAFFRAARIASPKAFKSSERGGMAATLPACRV